MNDMSRIETQPYVRPDVAAFLQFLNGIGGPEMKDMPLAEARDAYAKMKPIAEADARLLAVIRDLTCPGPAGDIPLRLYDPRESREPGPLVMFFHGGGFVIGDLETHHNLCAEIAAELDLPLLAVDYRLAPECPFPAAPDDCEAATRWAAASPAALGRQVTGLVITGDSAGGNLTIVTTQALAQRPAAVPVLVQAPLYPATDERPHPSYEQFGEGHLLTKAGMEWFHACYASESGNARAFPILGDHTRVPPTLVATASLDPIRDQGRAYAAELVKAGSDVTFLEMQGNIHGFLTLRKAIPSGQQDLLAILAALRAMLARATA